MAHQEIPQPVAYRSTLYSLLLQDVGAHIYVSGLFWFLRYLQIPSASSQWLVSFVSRPGPLTYRA
jgi:hypothetical protein